MATVLPVFVCVIGLLLILNTYHPINQVETQISTSESLCVTVNVICNFLFEEDWGNEVD